MTSIFKSNKFFRIIKHFLLTLPLMFALGVSIYTIVNPNAKDSYYGEAINDTREYFINDVNDFKLGTRYLFTVSQNDNYTGDTVTLYVTDFAMITPSFASDNLVYSLTITNSGGRSYIRFFRTNGNDATRYVDTQDISFYFTFVSLPTETTNLGNYLNYFSYFESISFSYLSNAFEYGMYEFTKVGFNKFDFVGLFDGIFTDNIHNVYTDFINSYINYYLMVECVYFVPWVIHIFIHFAYDLGDYFTSSFKRNRKEDD